MAKMLRFWAAFPVVVGLALAFPTAASAADGGGTSTGNMAIEPTASVVAGVAVVVTVDVTCTLTAPFFSENLLSIFQGRFAHGATTFTITSCTGVQRIPVTILADPSGAPFQAGPAFAAGQFFIFQNNGPSDHGSASAQITLQLGPQAPPSPPGPMAIEQEGKLMLGGDLMLTVDVTCHLASPFFSDSTLSIEQAVGQSIAHGNAFYNVSACTGTVERIPVRIPADPSGPAFHSGLAVASGFFFIGDNSGNRESGSAIATVELVFNIPTVSITGAPAGVVLSGDSITLTAVPSGGTGLFTYAWTKNGAPFATTQSITDTPALGATTYGVSVTDSLGAVSNTQTTLVRVYDFTVSGSPMSLQVLTSGMNTYAITESLVFGSPRSGLPTIALSLFGLPVGATPSFSPASGSAGGFSSTLTISTASEAPAGNYVLTLTGTDARPSIGGTRTVTLNLTIVTPAQAISNVIAAVNGLKAGGVLNGGQANSLIVKLNHAITSLTLKPDQPTACNQLQAFVNEVNAYVAAGILTPAQANQLLGGPLGIFAIMAAIPC